MKKVKTVLASVVLSFASMSASAVEFGVVGGGVSGQNAGGLAGLTVGQKFDRVGVTAGYAQGWLNQGDQNRFTLVGSYDVYRSDTVTVSGKVGYAYLNGSAASESAGLVGVGVQVPMTQNLSWTLDYAYQFAQTAANNGNVVTTGMLYRF